MEDFLLTKDENVTMAKKSYETFYNLIEINFYSKFLKDVFLRENFWWESVAPELDSWVAFYLKHGTFPGSQKLISIPKVSLPFFLKTDMPISPVDLYRKFAGTDAKGLVSIHALAAINIHFGGNKYISQSALSEYLKNLTYQALSQENDKIFMSFDDIGLLLNDFLEQFVLKENAEIEKASAISKEIKNQLNTNFQLNLSPEMKIQKGEEEKNLKMSLNQLIFQLLKKRRNRRNLS